tara:strand:+ start:1968 stop:3680 length:1713 start_codon:yes stop_codon:yes gene_type:complete
MIHFKNIRYKNFLSSGNIFTDIQLDKSSSTLIIGENGAGKSTMLDALTFSLFGKPFRSINKSQLINSINERGTVVECEFKIGQKEFLVRRGIKPNIFEIEVDGIQIEQNANVRDFQEFLEKQILKLNYKSFTQIVVLGNSSFVPFMQLHSKDRRTIIEDLLDIQIFSTMNFLLKTHLSENKQSIENNNTEKLLLDNKIELKTDYITQLKNKTKKLINQNRQEIVKNEKQKQELRDEASLLNKEVEQLLIQIKDLPEVEENRVKLDKYSSSIEHKCNQEQKTVSFYASNNDCPTCKQHIESEFKQQAIHQHEKEIEKYKTALLDIDQQNSQLQQRYESIQQVQQNIQSLQSDAQKKFSSIDAIDQYVQKIEQDINELESNTGDIKKEKQELQQFEKDYSSLQQLRESLLTDRELYEVAREILKDEGIKSRIIKQYLPIMNKLINKYLQEMDFFVSFNLDESFDETIKSRYRDDFTYASFSEGEKMRIDLALLFTWRAIAKLKNSTNTNLLILDEVFDSSLDTDGTDAFLKIMYEMGQSTNMFVISHKGDQLYDKFRNVIKFGKKKNFSTIL